jgi:tRNA (guanine-N7-)-methyltransferase
VVSLIPRIRLREHVNPLSRRYQSPVPAPDWQTIYPNWGNPLAVDIGCGRGEYLLQMAQACPQWNFLGIEIRSALVQVANQVRMHHNLTNLYYLSANVNVSLAHLCPDRWINQVSIQFPDPWFKRKQRKRRVVTPQLVQTLSLHLQDRAQILLQSDIDWVWQSMHKCFLSHPAFSPEPDYPDHIPTERETWTMEQGLPIYRSALRFQLVVEG